MADHLNDIAGIWCDWMWSMFWQVSLLIVLIAAIDLLIRKWAWPQLRHALWLLVLVKLVLPPGLSLSTSVTSHVQPLAKSAFTQHTEGLRVAPPDQLLKYAPAIGPSIGVPAPPGTRATAPLDTGQSGVTVSTADQVARPESTFSWQTYVMAVWLLGVLALIGYLVQRPQSSGPCQ